jgi:hypothetical protein
MAIGDLLKFKLNAWTIDNRQSKHPHLYYLLAFIKSSISSTSIGMLAMRLKGAPFS